MLTIGLGMLQIGIGIGMMVSAWIVRNHFRYVEGDDLESVASLHTDRDDR